MARIESYDFHASEVMQSMIEGRRGEKQVFRALNCSRATASDSSERATLVAGPGRGGNGRRAASQLPAANPPCLASHSPSRGESCLVVTYKDGTRYDSENRGTADRWNFGLPFDRRAQAAGDPLFNGPWAI